MATTDPTIRDQVIANAKSLPDLIQKASVLDPPLAAALTANAAVASKTPVGALLASAIGFVAAKYGFGWPDAIDELLAGALVLAGGYVTHWLQAKMAKPMLAPAPATGASA